jgi:hypothetical protein
MYLYYVPAKKVKVEVALFNSDINASRTMLKLWRTVTEIVGWCSNGTSR